MNELMDDLGHHLRRTNGAMKQIKQMTRMTKTQPDAEPLPLRLSPPEDCLKEENEFLSLPSPIWVLVTPELAKTWLDLNVRNRKIRPHHVSSLVREYWSGGWRVTSDFLAFDTNNNLANGQHRLNTIVVTGQPMVLGVVFGLDPDVFAVLDTGITRSAADTLYVNGIEQPGMMAVSARWVYRYLTDGVSSTFKITNHDIKGLVDANPDLLRSVQFVKDRADGSVRQDAVLSALHFLFANASREDADLFIGGILQGGETMVGADPRSAARKRLIQNRIAGRRRGSHIRPPQVMAEIIKCWNAYMRNGTIKSLRWLTGEPFPVISGLRVGSIALHQIDAVRE